MMPKACKDYCMLSKNCPDAHAMQFIQQLESAQHILSHEDLKVVCWSYIQDPSDDEEFVLNIWGI